MVGVAVAVQGGQHVWFLIQSKLLEQVGFLVCDGREVQTVVVHDVTAVIYFRVVDGEGTVLIHLETFFGKVVEPRSGRREEQRGAVVAHDAVDFFGHAFVERTQSGFDVNHGYVDFGCCHGTSEGGVGVAIQHDAVGLFVHKNLFNAFDHPGGLDAV